MSRDTRPPYMCIYIPPSQRDRVNRDVKIVSKRTGKSRSSIFREVLYKCLQKLSQSDVDLNKPVSIKFHL